MIKKTDLKSNNNLQQHLQNAKTLLYDKCGFEFSNLIVDEESQEYGACTFHLNKFRIKFRISKITKIKSGQFVTIWKRNKEGITQPFDVADEIDFVIISSQHEDRIGQFIFPKSVLLDKGIMAGPNKAGKRGIRVYPPWDTVTNKQAEKTQIWQTKYFLNLDSSNQTDLNLANKLLQIINNIDG